MPRASIPLSRLGLGLSRLHYIDEAAGVTLIAAARDLGITHFDTARLYGDGWSERVLGKRFALRQGRDKVTIATKFGLLPLIRAFEALGHRRSAFCAAARSASAPCRACALTRRGHNYEPASARALAGEISLKHACDGLRSTYLLRSRGPHSLISSSAADLFARLELPSRKSGVIRAVGVTAAGKEADALIAAVRRSSSTSWQDAGDGLAGDHRFRTSPTARSAQATQRFGAAAPDQGDRARRIAFGPRAASRNRLRTCRDDKDRKSAQRWRVPRRLYDDRAISGTHGYAGLRESASVCVIGGGIAQIDAQHPPYRGSWAQGRRLRKQVTRLRGSSRTAAPLAVRRPTWQV